MPTFEYPRFYDEGSEEVEDTAVDLTAIFSQDQLRKSNKALITVSGGTLLYHLDESNPVQGEPAHSIPDGQSITLPTKILVNQFRAINAVAAQAVFIYVTLFRD